mgnify:CR=1 FL=1
MATLKNREMTLQAFDIEHEDINSDLSDLYSVLCQRLNGDSTTNERRMSLSSSSSEEDVLTDFSISENGVFGVLMRISPTDQVAMIPDILFNEKTVKLGEKKESTEQTVTVLSTAYFFVGKKYVISSLPPSQAKRLQVYFNFLLSFGGVERFYNFAPTIIVPEGIRLNEMREFIIGDNSHVPSAVTGGDSAHIKIINVAAEYLKNLASITPNVEELIKNKILNARLLITFAKPRKMTDEDYKQFLSSHIKPIADADDIKIKLKNQKTLKGKDVLLTKKVSIERLDSLRLNEKDLLYEMKKFCMELES